MPDREAPRSALDAMVGERMPGGCDDCNAYQTVRRAADGVFVMTVHHDQTCPALAAAEREGDS